MKARPTNGEASTPLTLVDQFRERFEAACQAAAPGDPFPSLEDVLAEVPAAARPDVLSWLLRVEWDYRRKRGEEPLKDDYLARFPDYQSVVEAAWLEMNAAMTVDQGSPAGRKFQPISPKELSAKLPQFEVLELIGQGGMGAVYKARQLGPDRHVALKIIKPSSSHGAEFTDRFVREAKVLGKLDHPNIAAIHDSGQKDGLYFLVMDFADGGDLRSLVQHRIQAGEVMAIVVQICDALQFAHDKGVVHRDIKPANILLADRTKKRIKIGDFGLAKLLGKNPGDDTLTATDLGMGTMGYMAPEQTTDARHVDHRADIYSLGVVFYELLTGKRPAGSFPKPSNLVQIDRRIDDVVLRALEMEPEKRYQTVGELKAAVEAILQSPDRFTFLNTRLRSRNPFTTIKTAGLLLPIDLLTRIAEMDSRLSGLTTESYHLEEGEKLNEAVSRAWNVCLAAWKSFREASTKLALSDKGTTLTRDKWLLPLFKELGYGRLQAQKAIKIDNKDYPISHGWERHVPIHLVSFRYELDRRTPGAAGAASRSPYSLAQELLNRSAQHRWGFLSNGLKLYILRDNVSLARSANVEFDLEAMFEGEVYADFQLLFLVGHQSRVEIPADGKPEDCWLEKWSKLADDQGTRAREKLRIGVENAIKALGAGFLTTKGNNALKERLGKGAPEGLSTQDYYRQLLRTVYRLLLLLVAEEKKTEDGQNLLHPPETSNAARERYARFYSVGRIRILASKKRGTSHTDLYESLKLVFHSLRSGYAPLGIPGLGSFLFSEGATQDLDSAQLTNEALLDAIRELCETEDTTGRGASIRRPVDFANLGSDELGSVYESLLELHPTIDSEKGPFSLDTVAGHERKTTGSYYTPISLISCLLDSALDPVVTEALDKPTPEEAEKAILNLKICDPSCGSGHFLTAATERLAKRLAGLRTGDDEPSTLAIQHAKRDVIGRCIFGVDMNLLTVELCKVALWMEALEPGKPLSFLDHHLQCGNSLVGTTPALLSKGIPDAAFTPIEGDNKKLCAGLKKQNKQERQGYGELEEDRSPWDRMGNMAAALFELDNLPDDIAENIRDKEERYRKLVEEGNYITSGKFLADLWCAAFVWKKDRSFDFPITERIFRGVESKGFAVAPWMYNEVRRLAEQYQFFHWHLAFPGVFRPPARVNTDENESTGWEGGFDCILGNPPWDEIQFEETAWFASRDQGVAQAAKASERESKIEALRDTAPGLFSEYLEAVRSCDGFKALIRNSGQYPLGAHGKLNTYSLFAELNAKLLGPAGFAGCVLQTGVATDKSTSPLFHAIMSTGRLRSLFDFVNEEGLFPDVRPHQHFCLVTIGAERHGDPKSRFAAFLRQAIDLSLPESVYELSWSEIVALNPEMRTLSLFPSQLHADTARILAKVLVPLGLQVRLGQWKAEYKQGTFNTASDSKWFRTEEEIYGNSEPGSSSLSSESSKRGFVPLFDAKMGRQYEWRAATLSLTTNQFRKIGKESSTESQLKDPSFVPNPAYWVPRDEANARLSEWPNEWVLGFKDVTGVTSTFLASFAIAPRMGFADSFPLLKFQASPREYAVALTWLNSLIVEYILRFRMHGLHLTWHLLKQVPMPSLARLSESVPWLSTVTIVDWFAPRAVELSVNAWPVSQFARDVIGTDGIFVYDPARRFLIRMEIEAAWFILIGFTRKQVEFVLDYLTKVRMRDERVYGEYRTRRMVLELYDEMTEAIRTGKPYQTRLDPPPADPRVAHPPKSPAPLTQQQRLLAEATSFILLFLQRKQKPVSRSVLEAMLVLMFTDEARQSILAKPAPKKVKSTTTSPSILQWLDHLLTDMQAVDQIRIPQRHQQAFELGQNLPALDQAPPDHIQKLNETIQALEKLGEDQAMPYLSEVIDAEKFAIPG